MIKLIYHSINNETNISNFDTEIINLVRDKDIKIACPYINLNYFKRIIKICKDWRLITDLKEFITSHRTSREKEEIINFVKLNIKKIHNCPKLHAKVIISNEKIFTGSSNLTIQGITENTELSILIKDNKKNLELNAWYEDLWKITELDEKYLYAEIDKILKFSNQNLNNNLDNNVFIKQQNILYKNIKINQLEEKNETETKIPLPQNNIIDNKVVTKTSIPVIKFEQKIGKQMKNQRRAEFTIKNRYQDLLEKWNNFPQSYEVVINNNKLQGTLYKNPRPYYYFKILTKNINVFFNFIAGKTSFNVEIDLEKHIMIIK